MACAAKKVVGFLCLAWVLAPPVRAFSVFVEQGESAAEIAALAPRWSAQPDPFGEGKGLHDGSQVAVDAGFLQGLGLDEIAALYGASREDLEGLARTAVRNALAMWENSALRFHVDFGGPTERGPLAGSEIDLFAEPSATRFFGFTELAWRHSEDRWLTNGQRAPGLVIRGADVFLNTTRVLESARLLAQLGVPLTDLAHALQILVAHEVGHAIGLGHPNEGTFLDTNSDPFDPMVIDFADPFRDLVVSSIPLNTPLDRVPIMWGGLSSADPVALLPFLRRLRNPALTFDDLGGRDVLYPAPPLPPSPTASHTPSATATPSPTPTASPAPPPCPGDCTGDGEVTVDEIVLAVRIALETEPRSACAAADLDADGAVQVHELVRAVAAALFGCDRIGRE